MDAIVSPANSFGFMDGGIDMVGTFAETLLHCYKNVGKCPGGGGSTEQIFLRLPLKVPFVYPLLTNGNPFHLPTVKPPLTSTSPQSGHFLLSPR